MLDCYESYLVFKQATIHHHHDYEESTEELKKDLVWLDKVVGVFTILTLCKMWAELNIFSYDKISFK